MTEQTDALPLAAVQSLAQLPPSPGQFILEVTDLGVSIHGKITLRQVEVNIPDHQVVAVIGPSGAGKSTFHK